MDANSLPEGAFATASNPNAVDEPGEEGDQGERGENREGDDADAGGHGKETAGVIEAVAHSPAVALAGYGGAGLDAH